MKVYPSLAAALSLLPAIAGASYTFEYNFDIPDNDDPTAAGFTWVANDGSGIDWDITDGKLTATRTTSTTQSGLAIVPFPVAFTKSLVVVEFDMTFTGTTPTPGNQYDERFGMNIFAGDFPATPTTPPPDGFDDGTGVFFSLLNLYSHPDGPSSGWTFEEPDTHPYRSQFNVYYTGTQHITWVMNDLSPGDLDYSLMPFLYPYYEYIGPDGKIHYVDDGTAEVWIGEEKSYAYSHKWEYSSYDTPFEEETIQSLWIRWHRTVGVGNTWTIDNLSITVTPHPSLIPEPSTYALIGGLVALGAVVLRKRLRK